MTYALCPVCFSQPRQADSARCFECDPRQVGKPPTPPRPDRPLPPLIFPPGLDEGGQP